MKPSKSTEISRNWAKNVITKNDHKRQHPSKRNIENHCSKPRDHKNFQKTATLYRNRRRRWPIRKEGGDSRKMEMKLKRFIRWISILSNLWIWNKVTPEWKTGFMAQLYERIGGGGGWGAVGGNGSMNTRWVNVIPVITSWKREYFPIKAPVQTLYKQFGGSNFVRKWKTCI